MKTFTIPTTTEEVPDKRPFCNDNRHPGVDNLKVFNDSKMSKALAAYYCGTYNWNNETFTLGSKCIGSVC